MLHAFSALCKFMLLGMSVDKVVCDGQVKRNKVGQKQWVLLLSMFVYKVVRQQSSEEECSSNETVGIVAVNVCI